MATMTAVQLLAPGELAVCEVPMPTPGPGEVLLQVAAAGMCGSDVHLVRHPSRALRLPLTLGHETTGTVVSANGVPGVTAGDAVMVAGIWGCGQCPPCTEGRVNTCAHWATRSVFPPGPGLGYHGGMADYMVAPARSLVPLGDLDPVAAAPLADAGATSAHALNIARAHLRPGATVLVIGVGGLGHLALQLLRATTLCRVVAVDVNPDRLAASLGHGADLAYAADDTTAGHLRELTAGLGVDVVFDFAGSDSSLELARQSVASGGAIVAVGLGGGNLAFRAAPMPADRRSGLPWGVTVVQPYGATMHELAEVIALASAGRLHAEAEHHPLIAAPKVLTRLSAGQVRGRAVLLPHLEDPS
jgi:propanol-preferring alcohol dehydrogenase